MKSRFKLLSTSLIVALSFASSQASYSMNENDQEVRRAGQKYVDNILKNTAIEIYSIINENWKYPSKDNIISTQSKKWSLEYDETGTKMPKLNKDENFIPALDDLINNKAFLECAVAFKVVQIYALKNIMGDEAFKFFVEDTHRKFQDIKLQTENNKKEFNYSFFKELPSCFISRESNPEFRVSFVYISNLEEYRIFKPNGTSQGYNTVCIDNNKFISFSDICKEGAKSKKDFINDLKECFLKKSDVQENETYFDKFCEENSNIFEKKLSELNNKKANNPYFSFNFIYDYIVKNVNKETKNFLEKIKIFQLYTPLQDIKKKHSILNF